MSIYVRKLDGRIPFSKSFIIHGGTIYVESTYGYIEAPPSYLERSLGRPWSILTLAIDTLLDEVYIDIPGGRPPFSKVRAAFHTKELGTVTVYTGDING